MRTPPSRRRSGTISIEVAMFVGTVFVIAMLFYWLGQTGFVGLYQVISGHTGSPYM